MNTRDGYVASNQLAPWDPDAPRHDRDGSITGMKGRALFASTKEWDDYCAKKNAQGGTLSHGYGARTRDMRMRVAAWIDARTGEFCETDAKGNVTRTDLRARARKAAEGRRSTIYLDGRRIDIVQRNGRHYEAGTDDEYGEQFGQWRRIDGDDGATDGRKRPRADRAADGRVGRRGDSRGKRRV
jgi:hypothetical protein